MTEINENKRRFATLCLKLIEESCKSDERYILTIDGDRLLDEIHECCISQATLGKVIETVALIDVLKKLATNGKDEQSAREKRFINFLEALLDAANEARLNSDEEGS